MSLGITTKFKIIIPLWKDNVKEQTYMSLHFFRLMQNRMGAEFFPTPSLICTCLEQGKDQE